MDVTMSIVRIIIIIIFLYTYIIYVDVYAIAMEFIDGMSLWDFISNRSLPDLPQSIVLRIAHEVSINNYITNIFFIVVTSNTLFSL